MSTFNIKPLTLNDYIEVHRAKRAQELYHSDIDERAKGFDESDSDEGGKGRPEFECATDTNVQDSIEDEIRNFDPIKVKMEEDAMNETPIHVQQDCSTPLQREDAMNEIPIHVQQDCSTPLQRDNEPKSSSIIPVVGMKFYSEEEAYNFYNNYAKGVGFSIKKFHVERRKDGSLRFRKFVCSKQGAKGNRRSTPVTNPRAETRCNCEARVEFHIDRSDIWTLSRVEINHNHQLTSPNKVHMLRSQRRILPFQGDLIARMSASGMKAHNIFNYFQHGINDTEVGFIRDDNVNYIKRRRRKLLDGKQIKGILSYLSERQASDPSFFYSIEIHNTGEISNFFWADGKSISDYGYFGDVICFDTTFQTNEYDMPFAPIVGVNHHKQTIVFGAALLYDETIESFIWLFRTFMKAMGGQEPVTIFTDQSAAISKAIEIALPTSSHRLCLWHIFQNAATHLSHVLSSFPKFSGDLKQCVYERCSIEVFDEMWHSLLNKYNLCDNAWMANFYKLREKWAACHRVETFSADMTTTQRSESMNCHFKRFFKRQADMFEFLDQYDKALSFFREKEVKADYVSRNTTPKSLLSDLQVCIDAATVYTSTIYHEFCKEVGQAWNCRVNTIVEDATTRTYEVYNQNSRIEIVVYNPTLITMNCTCKMFESKGILCMHCLKVLQANNEISLPAHYILKRWTKYAREGNGTNVPQPQIGANGQESLTSMYNRICHKGFNMASKSMRSREVMTFLDSSYDRLMLEVEDKLRICDDPDEQCVGSNNIPTMNDPNITIRPPAAKKGRKEKRKKSVLERRPKKAACARTSNTKHKPEYMAPPSTQVEPNIDCNTGCAFPLSYTAMFTEASSYYCSEEASRFPVGDICDLQHN